MLMEKKLQQLIEQQIRTNMLMEKQVEMLAAMYSMLSKKELQKLKTLILDNTDLKEVLKVADTKFFSVKKLFKTYELDKKDYYLLEDIITTLKKHEKKTKP